jgi:predicted transcriptional regulator
MARTQTPKTVGERIRARRLKLGLSQRDIERPGVSNAHISRLEANGRTPSVKALLLLADALDTTALYLLTGKHHVPCPLCGRHEHGGTSNGNGNGRRSTH